MAAATERGLWIRRSEDGLLVSIADGDELLVSPDLMQRSNVLCNIHESLSAGESVRLEIPHLLFQSWLDIANRVHPEEATSTAGYQVDVSAEILMVQAADLLDDPESLSRACSLLAARAFPLLCLGKPEPSDEVRQRQAAIAKEVVEALPANLAMLTLRTALAAVPPRITGAGLQSTPPSPDRHLETWLPLIPEHLQPHLLRTFAPSLDADRSLSIELGNLATASCITEAAARGFGALLTSLTLRNCHCPRQKKSDGTYVDRGAGEGKAAIRPTIAPVAAMTALQQLHVGVTPAKKQHRWAEAFFACVGDALPQLPQLTRLCMSADGGEGAAGALRRVATLRTLRSLELKGYGFTGQGPAVQSLAAVLPQLTTLTHLSLSSNPLTVDGWRQLSPVVAPMPLQSLDISNCLLDYGCRFLPGPPSASNPAFPELETLNISRNRWSKYISEVGSALPKLKRLLMTEVAMPESKERALLRAMGVPPAPRLEEVRLGFVGMQPVPLAMLCDCLRRWGGLRVLVVQCAAVVPNLLVVVPLLCDLRGLQELELQCFSVDFEHDVAPLAQLTGLTKLRLGYLMCKHPIVCALGESICALTALQALEIAYAARKFDSETGAVWARAVGPLAQLTRLSLQNCCVGSTGTHELAQALTRMPGMRELELEQNRIKSMAAAALAPALGRLSMLSMLCLANNPIGDSGAAVLVECLPRMHALRELDMIDCALGAEGAERVIRAAPPGVREILFTPEPRQTV